MSDKICPIMSSATSGGFLYFSSDTKNCIGEECQWWWKCREPEKRMSAEEAAGTIIQGLRWAESKIEIAERLGFQREKKARE